MRTALESATDTSTQPRCTERAAVDKGVRGAEMNRAVDFITSKLNNGFHKPDDARRAFDNILALESDHVDMFLIHWPLPTLYGGDFVSIWKVLEEFARDGAGPPTGRNAPS